MSGIVEGDGYQRRRAVLKYMRVRYLVETAVRVEEKITGQPIAYRTRLQPLRVGRVPDDVVRTLMTSDVLIGLLDAANVGVLNELASRAILRGEWILLTEDQAEKLVLPTIFRGRGHVRADDAGGRRVLDWIELEAKSEVSAPLEPTSPISEELKKVVDEHDARLRSALEDALGAIEQYGVPGPFVGEHAEYLSPKVLGNALNTWLAYYPYSIWRIRWKGKEGPAYTLDQMVGQATLVGGNDLFASLFTMVNIPQFPPDPNGPDALTLEAAVCALERHVEPEDFRAFREDQSRLSRELILEGKFAKAEAPIRLSGTHPDPDFRGKSLMPLVLARRTVGDERGPHATYLMIFYVEAS